jgi:sulfate adenylyltransferase subunit 2
VLDETLNARVSERQGRISDGEDGGSLEQKKREGYF